MFSFQYVEKDLQGVKVKGWRQKAEDGEERASVSMKAMLSEGRTAKEKAGNSSSHLQISTNLFSMMMYSVSEF